MAALASRAPRSLVLRLCAVALALRAAGAAWMVSRRDGGTSAALTSFPLDDAWIHLVYARSLTRGELFTYLDGVPEAGSSSPLWAFVLAPLCALNLDAQHLVIGAKLVGVLLAASAAWMAALLAWQVTRSAAASWSTLALAALEPASTAASVSGMEVPLASFLMVSALWAHLARRPAWAGMLAGLCLLARPELALVALAIATSVVWTGRAQLAVDAQRRRVLRDVALALAPALVLGALWVGFCEWATGRPLPNTFYIKHAPPSLVAAFADTGRALFGVGRLATMGAGVGFVACAAALMGPSARHQAPVTSDSADAARRSATRFLVLFAVTLLLALIWAHDLHHPTWFYTERYLLPLAPLLAVLVSLGVFEMSRRAAQAGSSAKRYAWAAAAIIALAAPIIRWPSRAEADAARHAWSARNIEEAQERIAGWIAEHAAQGDWVATHDAGAIRFLTDANVLDLLGLNEHRIPSQRARLMRELSPRFVVMFPSWFPGLMRDPGYREVWRVRSDHYVVCVDCSQDVMVVLERRDFSPR